MIVRNGFYYLQAVAAFVLPAWLLVGWGLFGGGGLALLLVIVGSALLCVAMLIVGGITIARRSVRTDRAVSWIDVAVLAVWYAAVVATGFYFAWGGFMVAAVVLIGIAAFWSSIAQLFSETGRRVRSAFAAFPTTMPAPQPASFPSGATGSPRAAASPYADGEYIVIETSRNPEGRTGR